MAKLGLLGHSASDLEDCTEIIPKAAPAPLGKAFWICGVIIVVLNASLVWIRVPAR